MASDVTPPAPHSAHEGSRGVRDQVERYRSSFIAVVTMIVIAAVVGGYILAHQNLHLPGWVPVLGKNYYTLKARFQTAQAVTPGQGQAVTIAGAKVGEVATVELKDGVATVTMNVTPKYARFYKNATMLMRPKTALQDMTIEVNPGTPVSGKLHSGETLPVSQTAPNGDFDEFLAGLDAETRFYLQALLAGAGEGLDHNGRALSATLKRFLPTTRLGDRNHPRTAASPQEHRAVDPQLPAAGGSARRQERTARRAGERLQRRVRDLRQAGRQLPQDAAPAPRGAGKDRQRTRQGQDRLARPR